MKLRHAAALALVGWYLMLPPPFDSWKGKDLVTCAHKPFPCGERVRTDISAPLSKWQTTGVYDSANACTAAQRRAVQAYHEIAGKVAQQFHEDVATTESEDHLTGLAVLNSRCIASDDPRLAK